MKKTDLFDGDTLLKACVHKFEPVAPVLGWFDLSGRFSIMIMKDDVQEENIEAINELVKALPLFKKLSEFAQVEVEIVGYDEDFSDVRALPEVKKFVRTLLWAAPMLPYYLSTEGRALLRECASELVSRVYIGPHCLAFCEDSDAWRYAAKICGIEYTESDQDNRKQ